MLYTCIQWVLYEAELSLRNVKEYKAKQKWKKKKKKKKIPPKRAQTLITRKDLNQEEWDQAGNLEKLG